MKMHPHATVLAVSLLLAPPVFSQTIVSDDIITGSNQSSEWLLCDSDSPAIDVTALDAGGCAFRTTPAEAGITYRMSCGVTVAKYASITLAFLDADDNTLTTKSTEVTEHVSGAYSVTLESPAGTTTAAIGIYGEPGSGFQDCVLIDATPAPEPTKGSISGLSWFDANGDNVFDDGESTVSSTSVALYQNNTLLQQSETDLDGSYYFGNLDIDACYTVSFSPLDATLELGTTGGANDALSNGSTNDLCLTEAAPDVMDIDAAFVAVPPPIPPADNTICGVTWVDANANGMFDGSDTTIANVSVKLMDNAGDQIAMLQSDSNGNYVFEQLTNGDYSVMFVTPDGHEPTSAASAPEHGLSVIGIDGITPAFNLPSESNTSPESACTMQHINAGYSPLPVALPPTVANDDNAASDVGVPFTIDFLANDMPCEGSVHEVDILGHNVPGEVIYDAAQQMFVISNTTAAGTYSIEYGLRGTCGSHDTATINIVLAEVPPPPPVDAPDAPICRVETGGSTTIGGVDVFNSDQNGFASNYNFYDRDNNLVITVDSSNYTHKYLIGNDANQWEGPYKGNWEIEWNGTNYQYNQTSIFFVGALENGIESELTECDRSLVSPIAIDLENKGRIQRIRGEFVVDIDGDGTKETLSQWFAPTAGILVTSDATGEISGEFLFGNVPGVYADGFAELATLDTNTDGQLTNKELHSLAIWTDTNSNTIVDQGELTSLESHQIVALEVEHYKFMARASKSNGKRVLMEDVWLPLASVITAENR